MRALSQFLTTLQAGARRFLHLWTWSSLKKFSVAVASPRLVLDFFRMKRRKPPLVIAQPTKNLEKLMLELATSPQSSATLKTRPGANSAEAASLNALLDIMNSPDLQNSVAPVVPAGAQTKLPVEQSAQIILPEYVPPDEPKGIAPPPSDNQKLFFTGRLKAGKDHAAAAAGATIFGFADPMYVIASNLFYRSITSTEGKDLPGARAMLQAIGQWGRGTISEQYPLTPARASFIDLVRRKGLMGEFGELYVDWTQYGFNENIWLDSALLRVNHYIEANPSARVAITNVRFENELKALKAAGWSHFHVMTSAATWSARLIKSKLTPESPAVKDISEKMAAGFDGGVIRQISAQKVGPMLRVIWNDDTPPPSARLHTVASFLKFVNVQPLPASIVDDNF